MITEDEKNRRKELLDSLQYNNTKAYEAGLNNSNEDVNVYYFSSFIAADNYFTGRIQGCIPQITDVLDHLSDDETAKESALDAIISALSNEI